MVKKSKLKTDDFDIDSELDFGDFGMEEIDSGINPEIKSKKRNPVIDVYKGSISGVKETFKNPAFVTKVVKESLPDNYGTLTSAVGDTVETGAALYDEAVRELKPQLGKIAKKVNRLVPDESKGLKRLTGKVAAFFGDESGMSSPTKEQMQDQSVVNALGEVFGQQENRAQQAEARENAEDHVRDHIEGKRFKSNFGVLSSIDTNIQKFTNYNEKINQAYQKKSLELQFRSYFVQSELLQVTNKYFEVFKNQNEGIAKNTALPEFVKINNSERFLEISKTKFFDSVQTSLFGPGSAFNRGLKRLKLDASKYIKGAKEGLQSGMMGLDAVEQLQEANRQLLEMGSEGISSAEIAGSMMGSMLGGKVGEYTSKKVKGKLEEHQGVMDFGYKSANVLNNLPGAIDTLRKKDSFREGKEAGGIKGFGYNLLDTFLNYGRDSNPDMKIDNTGGMKQSQLGAVFDGKTQRSIVDIIPGYLSRILREISILRTGDENTQMVVFDQTKNKFITKKEMGGVVKGVLSKRIKASSYNFKLDRAADTFDENLAEDTKKEVKTFFSKISKIQNMDYTPENILNTQAYQGLSPATQKLIKDNLDAKITNATTDKFKNQSELTSSISQVREATPDVRGEIELFIKNGYGDVLEDEGIVTRDENGNYTIDEEAYFKLLESEGIVTSDKNAKKDIREVNVETVLGAPKQTKGKVTAPKSGKGGMSARKRKRNLVKSDVTTKEDINPMAPNKALEAIKNTKIFKWFYKQGEGDSIEHTGPMAQDVNQTMGEDAAPGGVKLDLTTMNGNNMAAIQALSEKQDKMVGSESSGKVLRLIKEDTATLVELMKAGKGTGTGAINDGSYTGIAGTMFGQAGTLAGKLTGDAVKMGKQAADYTGKAINSTIDVAEKVVPKVLNVGVKATKGLLAGIEGLTGGNKSSGKGKLDWKKRLANLTADDLLKLRALQQNVDAEGYQGKLAKRIMSMYPHLKDVDTSDEAVDAARNNPNAGNTDEEGSYEDRSIISYIGSIGFNISEGLGRGLNDLAFNKIPKAVELVGKMKNWLKDKATDIFAIAQDVYLKGQDSPVIKASLLKAGYYYDQATGKVIRTMGDLNNLKGNVVNKAGEIILTIEDASNGLFDNKGEKIKTGLTKLFNYAVGKVGKILTTGRGFTKGSLKVGKFLAEKGSELLSKLPGLGNIGFGTGKIYDVLLEIRDILKGDAPKSKGTIKEGEEGFIGPMPLPPVESIKQKLKEKSEGWMDKAKNAFNKFTEDSEPIADSKIKTKPLSKRSAEKARRKALIAQYNQNQKGSIGELEEGKKSSMFGRAKNKVNELKDKAKQKLKDFQDKRKAIDNSIADKEDLKLANSNTPASVDLNPKYRSGTNVIDSMISKVPSLGKIKSTIGLGKGKLAGIKGLLGSLMGKSKTEAEADKPKFVEDQKDEEVETTSAKPKEERETNKEKAERNKKERKAKKKSKLMPDRDKIAFNDKDGDGKREGNVDDEFKRKEELKKANNKGPAKVDLKSKYRSSENIIDTMMNKASGLFDLASKGLGGIFGGAGDMMSTASDMIGLGGKGGILGKLGSLGKGALGFVKAPIKGAIAAVKGVGGLLRGGVGLAGKAGSLAVNVGRIGLMAGSTLGSIATGAISAVGSGLAAIAATLTSPVVLGTLAVAAVGYGAYKAYKYFTRDKVDDFEQIRMYQYGLTKENSSYNHLMLSLEEYLLDGKIGFDAGQAYIINDKAKPKELIDIFSIDENDEEKCIKFHDWYVKRFKPFFLTHVTALHSVNKKLLLNKVSKLTEEEQLKFLPLVTFDGGPYGETTSPVDDPESLDGGDNKDAVKSLVDTMLGKLKKGKSPGILGSIGSVMKNVALAALPGGLVKLGMDAIGKTGIGSTVGKAIFSAKDFISKKFDSMLPGLSAIGEAIKRTGPLGAMAVSAVSGIYRFFSKGNSGKYDQIRALQYGFSAEDGYLYQRVQALESYLLDSKIGYDNGRAFILDKTIDNTEMLTLMSIDGADKEACEKFTAWYTKRFKPFFLTHVTALYSVNKKLKLDDVYKLTVEEQLKFLPLITYENGPYGETTSPFKDIVSLNGGSNKDLAKKAIDIMVADFNKEMKKKNFLKDLFVEAPKPAVKPESKTANKSTIGEATPKALPNTNEAPKPNRDLNKEYEELGAAALKGDDQGGDGKVNDKTISSASSGTMAALKEAGGPLKDGKGADQFIRMQPGVKFDDVNPAVLQNFRAMVQEYGEATGKQIQVNSGSRNSAEQAALYKRDPKTAAAPGRSLHEFGLALDINSKDANEMEDAGLMRKYGFTRPIGGEPWHIEPAGIQTNISLAKKDPNFATQAVDASLFRGGGGMGTMEGVMKGKRDPAIGVKLLDMDAQIVKATTSKDKVTELALQPKKDKIEKATSDVAGTSTGKPTATVTDISTARANKSTSVSTSIAQSEKYSKTDSLPDVDSKPKQASNTDDGKGKVINVANKADVVSLVEDISKKQGLEPDMMTAYAAVESGLNPNAKAKTSSASGLFQFTKGTWDEQMSKHARKHNLDPNASPNDPTASTLMATEYVKSNMKSLKSVKPNPNVTDVYLAHFLGAGGARQFLAADPNKPGNAVLPDAADSNKSIFYENGRPLSISEIYSKIENKIVKTAKDFGVSVMSSFKPSTPSNVTDPAIKGTSLKPIAKEISNKPEVAQVKETNVNKGVLTSTAPTVDPADQVKVSQAPIIPKSEPGPKKGSLTPPSTGIISSMDDANSRNRMQTGTDAMSKVSDTLIEQLTVQKSMLEQLTLIASNVDPEKLRTMLNSLGGSKPESNVTQPKPIPKQRTTTVDSAVDLRRKIA